MSRYYESVDFRTLPKDVVAQVVGCVLIGHAVEEDVSDQRRDVMLNCPDIHCACDRMLRSWRANWSRMPR